MAKGPNPAMRSKRVTGPTPNTEMITRIRVQEARLGGPFVFNPRTGGRRVIAELGDSSRGAGVINPASLLKLPHQR
jgi:hypothetical protein